MTVPISTMTKSSSSLQPGALSARTEPRRQAANDSAETGGPRSRPLYNRVEFGRIGGHSVDGRPAQRTRPDAPDKLKHLFAKVRVAGSNPVFRSRNLRLLAGLMRTARRFSSLFLPITAHHLPITGQGWSDGSGEGLLVSRGPTHSTSASTAVRIRVGEVPLADAHGRGNRWDAL